VPCPLAERASKVSIGIGPWCDNYPDMQNRTVFQEVFWPELGWAGFLRMLALGCLLAVPVGSIGAGGLPRPDRQWLVRLQQVRQQIADGRIAEAAPGLQQILTSGQTGYAPVEDQDGLLLPLTRAAALLIESLPSEDRAVWETWCAGGAAGQLAEVVQHRDLSALRAVVDQYPGTRFAAEAALLLASDAWDRRQWPEAIRWAERVVSMAAATTAMKQQALLIAGSAHLRRGQEAQARQCFGQLLALGPVEGLRIGGQPAPLGDASADASVDRLIELLRPPQAQQPQADKESHPGKCPGWPMFRGDPARNASVCWTASIGRLRWRLEMEGVSEIEGLPARHAFGSERGLRFFTAGHQPSIQPILVEDLALVRLPTRLVVVDLWTGRQRWEYPRGGDPAFQQIQGERAMPDGPVLRVYSPQAQLTRQRLFEDAPYGQMTVHENRLFLLDELGLVGSILARIVPQQPSEEGTTAKALWSSRHNRLICFDLRKEGKLLWSVGGASGEDEPALAGVFFLGPPLPLEDRLFVLLEKANQLHLAALAETNGQLLWSMPIAVPDRPITQDLLRRVAGAMLSYADGVLICPTLAGAILAVDPWTRNVLWAYEIPGAEAYLGSRRINMLKTLGAMQPVHQSKEHFSIDNIAILAEGYVVIAPLESDQMFCLELQTGRPCWKKRLEDFRYVAGVAKGVVLAVGSQSLSGWDLRTGKPAWQEESLPLPEGFTTAGRGFRQQNRYWLPIVKGEESAILVVDIPTGRVEERLTLPTKTRIGNLAAAGQTLIFVSSEGVEAFGPEKP